MNVNIRNNISCLVVTLMLTLSTVGWAKGNLELKNEAFQEIEEVAKDGKKSKKVVPATKIAPGTDVIFVITYKNVGKEPATDVIITNPVPKHMLYRAAESEKAGTSSEVSVDGGKKYGELAKLKVTKLRKIRPALPSDVTHVRWKVVGALAPNEEGKVQLRAMLE